MKCLDKNGNILEQGTQVKVIGPVDEHFVDEMEEMVEEGKIHRIDTLEVYGDGDFGILIDGWWFDTKNVIAVLPMATKDIKPEKRKSVLFDPVNLVT